MLTAKKLYVSPFNQVDGYYLVQAPRPDGEVDITVALHRDHQPAFVADAARRRGGRRPPEQRRDHANHLAAGTVDGGPAHPNTGHQAVVTSGSGGTAMSQVAANHPKAFGGNRFRSVGQRSRRCRRAPSPRHRRVIADRLLRRAAARLPLRLVYPDGTVIGAADPTAPTMVIHQPDALARRIGRYGLIGFGESYMAGEWSVAMTSPRC